MGALKFIAQQYGHESLDRLRQYGAGCAKHRKIGCGARSGRAAEGTVLEMTVPCTMMRVVSRHLRGQTRRADLELERHAAGRHEPGRDVRSKQQHSQDPAAG